MVIPITWGSYGMLFTLVGAILELVIFSNITSNGSVMLRAYEVIIVEVVRSHMPFSVRFAVACMRGIGYHVAHAFSARC